MLLRADGFEVVLQATAPATRKDALMVAAWLASTLNRLNQPNACAGDSQLNNSHASRDAAPRLNADAAFLAHAIAFLELVRQASASNPDQPPSAQCSLQSR